MVSEPGSLDGFAAARQDLWRLAHMTIYLLAGVVTLRESGASDDDAELAALDEIGKRGAAEAERLADIEAGDPTHTVARLGVTKPLLDLALDWGSGSTAC